MDSTVRKKPIFTDPEGLKKLSSDESKSGLREKLQRLVADKDQTSVVRSPAKGSFLHRVCYMIPKDKLDALLREDN